MKYSALLFAAIPALASANVVSLNDANFDSVTSGSPLVFIKFFAPWCGHCKAMAADWIELGKAMQEEKPDLLIGEVDCTADDAKELCQKNGIQGFPTLMYGDVDFLESYDGSREFDEMYSFATSGGLQLSCSPKHIDLCDDAEKEKLEKLMAMTIEELKNMVDGIDDQLNKMESDFDGSTDVLEEEYMGMLEKSTTKKNEAKEAAKYQLLKGVQAVKEQASSDKDEL